MKKYPPMTEAKLLVFKELEYLKKLTESKDYTNYSILEQLNGGNSKKIQLSLIKKYYVAMLNFLARRIS